MKHSTPSLELRAYRYISVILLSVLTSIAGYLATSVVKTSEELPAIKQQLVSLNDNLARLQEIPIKVQSNAVKIEELDKRVATLEYRRKDI